MGKQVGGGCWAGSGGGQGLKGCLASSKAPSVLRSHSSLPPAFRHFLPRPAHSGPFSFHPSLWPHLPSWSSRPLIPQAALA